MKRRGSAGSLGPVFRELSTVVGSAWPIVVVRVVPAVTKDVNRERLWPGLTCDLIVIHCRRVRMHLNSIRSHPGIVIGDLSRCVCR